jgi:2-oxoglutarate dehydrogenase E2 component (dihydrolipoamide succinyltransferase)
LGGADAKDMVADTNTDALPWRTPDVLPWRTRGTRITPAGFVPPRTRFGHAERSVRIPFSRVQARASVGLTASKLTSAHAYAIATADYSALGPIRASAQLTYLPFVARAVALALQEFRELNAVTDGEDISPSDHVHLGIAVDLAHQGLVVPVVRDAEHHTVRGLGIAIADVATRARSKQLLPDEVVGGTFTITNPGGLGTHWSFPIINQPQVAILSTDGVRKRVVANEAGDGLAIRSIGSLGLGYDARAVHPARAAAFLHRVAELIAILDWQSQL